MSKGRVGGRVGEGGRGEGESEGGGEGLRVVFEAVELAAEVVDGGGDMLVVSMVRALMTSADMMVVRDSRFEIVRVGGGDRMVK